MKFTDSPVVEVTVVGEALSFVQDNGSMYVGTSIWPASLALLKFADLHLSQTPQNPNPKYSSLLSFTGKRGIELGTGCGVAGIGLAFLGLDVILTDIAAVIPALKRNLKRNSPVLASRRQSGLAGKAKIAQLYWNGGREQVAALKPPFDFVIATDVVYLEELVVPFVETVEAVSGPETVILFGYQLRSPEADRLFWELCRERFEIERVAREDLHPEYAWEEVDVYVMRKKR